jgi:hypothetical protein
MAIDFKCLFNQIKDEVIAVAKEDFKTLAAEAASDGTSLLHNIENKLKKYIKQLADGVITQDDFKLLVSGNKDLVEMSALTQAGLAEAEADAFKQKIFDIIINSVFSLI